jgi:hypothetical protein
MGINPSNLLNKVVIPINTDYGPIVPLDAKKILLLSESILASGDFSNIFQQNFPENPTLIESLYSSSHISPALGEMAERVYRFESGEWVQKKLNWYNYKDVDAAIISYGRNESLSLVEQESHFRAYDKLMEQCVKRFPAVLPTNPPPRHHGDFFDSDEEDLYSSWSNHFEQFIKKWNNGVNVFKMFREFESSGIYTATELKADTSHQNETGSLEMSKAFTAELTTNRKIANSSISNSTGELLYLNGGNQFGNWTVEAPVGTFENRLLEDGTSHCLVSTSVGDYLLYEDVTCEHIQILFQQTSSDTLLDVIIDEGTSNQKNTTVEMPLRTVGDRMMGRFVIDFLEKKPHTIKIKNNGSIAKIHGIVVF